MRRRASRLISRRFACGTVPLTIIARFCRHGGIYSQFFEYLYPRALLRVQQGLGSNGLRSRATGELASGPETLSSDELAAKADRRLRQRLVVAQ